MPRDDIDQVHVRRNAIAAVQANLRDVDLFLEEANVKNEKILKLLRRLRREVTDHKHLLPRNKGRSKYGVKKPKGPKG